VSVLARIAKEVKMRLPLLPPSSLSNDQKALYDDVMSALKESFESFIVAREDGALIWAVQRHVALSDVRPSRLGHEQDDV
jgi:hypothetical protein